MPGGERRTSRRPPKPPLAGRLNPWRSPARPLPAGSIYGDPRLGRHRPAHSNDAVDEGQRQPARTINSRQAGSRWVWAAGFQVAQPATVAGDGEALIKAIVSPAGSARISWPQSPSGARLSPRRHRYRVDQSDRVGPGQDDAVGPHHPAFHDGNVAIGADEVPGPVVEIPELPAGAIMIAPDRQGGSIAVQVLGPGGGPGHKCARAESGGRPRRWPPTSSRMATPKSTSLSRSRSPATKDPCRQAPMKSPARLAFRRVVRWRRTAFSSGSVDGRVKSAWFICRTPYCRTADPVTGRIL